MAIDERTLHLINRMAAKGFEWRLEPTEEGTMVRFTKDRVSVDISSNVIQKNPIPAIERNIEFSYMKAIG